MKMIVVFEKAPRLRHIGHLDLMRAMQRALRRSGLPLRYSQGFNPHILLTFAAPLSVGMPGRREIMEVPLAEDMTGEAFLSRLSPALLCQCKDADKRFFAEAIAIWPVFYGLFSIVTLRKISYTVS